MRGAARLGGFPAVMLTIIVAGACTAERTPAPLADTGSEPGRSYVVRLDSESSDASEFQVVEDDDGIRIHTGPAGIAYRESDSLLTGDLQVQATFLQFDAPPGYREAYGIFVGGIDLQGADPEYTYLLVRPTGDFMVKRRIGAITETLADWTAHPSVQTVKMEGDRPSNTLGIDVFAGQVNFVVNGDVVHQQAAPTVRPYGVAGIRVNHRLDVRVDGWLMRGTSGESQ